MDRDQSRGETKADMEVIFRVDANAQIGHGHLSRCLVLADALEERGRSSTFVLREPSQQAASKVEQAGHRAILLAAPEEGGHRRGADKWLDVHWEVDARQTLDAVDDPVACVVVDQYGLDFRWERFVAARWKSAVTVIDGGASRVHDCDVLIDPTYQRGAAKGRWARLVTPNTSVLAGPRYALLRREFSEALDGRRGRNGAVKEVLVAFGGSDAAGATEMVMEALAPMAGEELCLTVVAGASKPDLDRLERRCAELEGVTLHVDTKEMAKLMASADLAIGGAGTMTWERAFLGLPAIVIAIAEHQVDVARPVAEAGAIRYLGTMGEVVGSRIRSAVEKLTQRPETVREMERRSRQLMEETSEVGTAAVAEEVNEVIEQFQKGE